MKKRFTLCLLHSSHTDVGYTDTQEKMKAHHIAFIREALELIQKELRFKWNCESYWCVEQFLQVASPKETELFVNAVLSGNIGLSASYLNLTDLVPGYVHNQIGCKMKKQRDALGITAESAMTADVNGYSWGVSDILYRQGVKNLMSCIHTHHGYHPLFRKQTAFWWESPEGNRILVWNGEHYNLGNELGIAMAPWFEYTIQDGMSSRCLEDYEKAVLRIHAYVDSIQKDGYEFSFVPVSLSGNMTDNSPPSLKILEFADRFNREDMEVELKMCTLDEFFTLLRNIGYQFPVYRGDWTDWWADGVASTPNDLIQYRLAARSLHVSQKLDPSHELAPAEWYRDAVYNLMFYGEHTWGYSSSITEPFHPQVNNLAQWKRLYALKACEAAGSVRESIQRHFGETAVSLQKRLKFRAVNPHDIDVEDMLVIDLEHFYGYENFVVMEEDTGLEVPFQISRYSRGPEICIWLPMKAKETKTFCLRELPEKVLHSAGLCAPGGIEGVNDLYRNIKKECEAGGSASLEGVENRFFSIRFMEKKGIVSIYDKQNKKELITGSRPFGAFTPIYEVTHPDRGEDYLCVRRNMGRNRKAFRTKRSEGMLYDVKVLENGPLYSRIQLKYQMDGVKECSLILTAYKLTPKLAVDVRLHKESVWEPENLYVSLPFSGETMYLDKADALVRPRLDQLPGTCVDFYAVQNGILFEEQGCQTIITCPDTPLISMGPLKAHPIRLMGEDVSNCDEVYSWVMNNFWETNFNADLGGFYQFHYELAVKQESDIQNGFLTAEAMNEGVLAFYLFVDETNGPEQEGGV